MEQIPCREDEESLIKENNISSHMIIAEAFGMPVLMK